MSEIKRYKKLVRAVQWDGLQETLYRLIDMHVSVISYDLAGSPNLLTIMTQEDGPEDVKIGDYIVEDEYGYIHVEKKIPFSVIYHLDEPSSPDGEPDPDLEYTWHCETCGEEAGWSMNNAADGGTPGCINEDCDNCGEDMVLGKAPEDVKEAVAEANRRDEKRGLHPDKEDVAN